MREFLKSLFFGEIWGFKGQIWAIFTKKWKIQKLPHSNERTLPSDDLGQFIAFFGQFKFISIIFPKSPIENKLYFVLYRKYIGNPYIFAKPTQLQHVLILQQKKIF